MSLPPEFLDDLRSRVSLAGVIGRRVRLQRKGREYLGLCPFHNEKTPSFTVVEDKGFYHCFGCGAHGDVLSFVMQTEGLSFPEAVEKLAGEAGLTVPKASLQARAEEARRASLHEVVEAAALFFQAELTASGGAQARRYLADRGLSLETIARFRLGYAPARRGALKAALAARGIEEAQMVEAGLLKRPEGGGELREYFFDRVIFPIADRRGRLVAFGGRTLGDAQPKYLNSPDGALFHKGRLLYNLDTARSAVRATLDQGGARLVLVEGYMDVIALAQAGQPAAVAPLGTAVTEEQLQELWRLVDEPAVCLDGDAAGRRAALRAAERALPLLAPGKSLAFAFLPAGEDPDSLVRTAGPRAFETVVAAARPLADIVWERALESCQSGGRRLETPERWAAFKQTLLEAAGAVRHAEVQRLYRGELLDRFYALKREQARRPAWGPNGGRGRQPQPVVVRVPAKPRPEAFANRRDAIILALVLNHPSLLAEHLEALADFPVQGTLLKALKSALIDAFAEQPALDSEALKSHLSRSGLTDSLAKVLTPAVYAFCAAARPEAPLDLARRALEGTLADHVASEAARAVEEAERRFAADPSEENLAQMRAAIRLAQEAQARCSDLPA